MSKSSLSKDRVFALKGFTVKIEGTTYFVAPTTYHGAALRWSKGYKSLQHATAAIARRLQREFTERNKRLERG